jgi:hypothetical protein
MFAAMTQPQLTCQDFDIWEVPQAHGLGGPDAAGLHDGVLAVDGVDVLGVVAARPAADPAVRDVGAGDGVPPAGLLLIGGEVAHLAAGGLHSPGDPAQPAGPFPARLIRSVISATALSCSTAPSWPVLGFHASAGTCMIAGSRPRPTCR